MGFTDFAVADVTAKITDVKTHESRIDTVLSYSIHL